MKIKIFLAGDVMLGRGIDQILPKPSSPEIFEPYIKDARDYIALAERVSGKINYPVSFDYIWGDSLIEIKKQKPYLKIINLETTITKSSNFLPKGINYRMSPENSEVLKVLKPDICVIANNHILDYGKEGLIETIKVLKDCKIEALGAGENLQEAKKAGRKGKVVILSWAHLSSGVPLEWKAKENRAGVNLLEDLSKEEILKVKNEIEKIKEEDDFLIFSIHWGPNWGYEVEKEFVDFAHRLIDFSGVDLVFGHSSHHFKGLEVYNGKLIIYGAGDFINDYEGIAGFKEFNPELVLIYFPEVDLKTKKLISLRLIPLRIKKFTLNHLLPEEIDWVLEMLERESKIEGKLKFIRKESQILLG
jgi:poly-gamma-glutamate synthesis protein (capsule biosynthesis protein)